MPLEKTRTTLSAKTTNDLNEEKTRALFEIAIMKEMEDIFKESELSDEDTSMILTMAKNSIRTLITHVRDGVISTGEFCEMQRCVFRATVDMLHNA